MALTLIALMIVIIILIILIAMIAAIMRDINSHGAEGSVSRDIGSLDCDGVNASIAATVSFRADLQRVVSANSPVGRFLLAFSTARFIAAHRQNFPPRR